MSWDTDAHEHDGQKVDLSITETLAALENPAAVISVRPTMWGRTPMVEYQLCIMFQGEWFELARTDLFDDVCTGGDAYRVKTDLQEVLNFWRGKVRLGARVKRYPHRPLPILAIVDSLSDG